jgi:prolyl-tRNA synthetase
MRLSSLFGNTLRETPADAQTTSQRLLLRAGMIGKVSMGLYGYLPLGWRAVRKVEQLLRQEIQSIDGQEILLPPLRPAELLEPWGRESWRSPAPTSSGDQNRGELLTDLSPVEAMTLLASREIGSYRQLPRMIYQIQTKLRAEPSATKESIGAPESIVMEGCSFHAERADLDAFCEQVVRIYARLFQRCEIDVAIVEGAPVAPTEPVSQEFVAMHDAGEEELFFCDECGYSAKAQIAASTKPNATHGPQLAPEKVATPGVITIEDLSRYLEVQPHETLKTLCYVVDGEPLLVVIRGDLDVNETKLARLLQARVLRLADRSEAERSGVKTGYASPVGLNTETRIVGDESIKLGCNFVAGANAEGYHLRNVNYPRDFGVDVLGDFATVRDGDPCPSCAAPLRSRRGFTLARASRLGTIHSQPIGAEFTDKTGRLRPLLMGAYSVDVTRLVSAAVEQHHDERGITWPQSIAPFDVHLVSLGDRPEIVKIADSVYEELTSSGLELLYDDRDENAGVKFADADLIGVSLRLTVGPRSLAEGGIELKHRALDRPEVVPLKEVLGRIRAVIEEAGPGSGCLDGDRSSRQKAGR